MKFYCDKCQTKYSIADEKVRGKVLKVRCKKCSNVITVREPENPVHAEATVEMSSGGLGQQRVRSRQSTADNALSGAAAAARVRARLSSVSSSAARPVESAASSVSWHYSINGETFGPYTFEHLRAQFASARLTDAAYVWNETFSDWKPVGEVAEFATAIESGKVVRPAQSTLGVSGVLKAITVEDYQADREKRAKQSVGNQKQDLAAALSERTVELKGDSAAALLEEETLKDSLTESEGFSTLVNERASDTELDLGHALDDLNETVAGKIRDVQANHEAEQETLKGDFSLPIEADKQRHESASERLQRLRDRLKNSDPAPAIKSKKSTKSKDSDLAFSETAEQSKDDDLEARTVDTAFDAAAIALADEVTFKDPAFQVDKPAVKKDALAGLFDNASDALEEATLRDDTASLQVGADTDDVDVDSAADFFSNEQEEVVDDHAEDAVPFFPAAPKLSSSQDFEKSSNEAYSGSLLIELDKLKKEQRSKYVWVGLAAAVLAIVVVGIYIGISSVETPEDMTAQVVEEKEAPRELVFRRYSKEEQGRIHNTIEIPDEVVADSVEPEALAKSANVKVAPAIKPRVAQNEPSVVAPVADKVAPAKDPFEAAMQGARAHNPVETKSGLQRNEGTVTTGIKTTSPGSSGKADEPEDDKFKAFAAIKMPSGDAPIYQPSDALKNRNKKSAQTGGGLTDAQASAGFQTVRQSISLCRERTMQRGLNIDVAKIYITLEIQPTGKVSSYTVEPASVRGSEFDRCMVSHTSRWKFASYSGEVTLIKAPFILQ